MTTRRITNGDGSTAMPKRTIHEICEALMIDLNELDEYGQEIAEAQAVADELIAKRKELAAVEAETAKTQAELEKAKRGLTQAQFDTLHNWDQQIFAKRAELTELQHALPKAEAELAATEKALAAADAKHKRLEAHIEKFKEDGRRHEHHQVTRTCTATPAASDRARLGCEVAADTSPAPIRRAAHVGASHLPKSNQHLPQAHEGASQVSTAIDIVAFISSLNVAQLDALAHAIGRRKAQLEDGALLRDIVADQRVNPQHAIPPSPTEWSHHRLALFDLEQEQKAEARRNGGGGGAASHGRWG
jgi:hypothetical protein